MAVKKLELGAKGPHVKALQEALNGTKPSPKLKVDGVFGEPLEKALKAFQKKNGLKADGVAGKKTGVALLAAAPRAAQKVAKALGAEPEPEGDAADGDADSGGKHKLFKEDYFTRMMRLAKQGEQLQFGFGLGDDAASHTFVVSDEFAPRQIWQRVKTEVGAKKGGYGSMSLQGTTMLLTVEKRISGLKKHMKAIAKERGWKWKTFRLVDPDGNEILEEGDEAPKAARGSGGGSAGGATAGAAAAAGAGSAPAAPPAAAASADVDPALIAKMAAVRTARIAWVQARDTARKDVGRIKAALRKAYRRDATQLPLVMEKARLFDEAVADLSDDLRRNLDAYLRTAPDAAKEIAKRESAATALVGRFTSAVEGNALLAAVDEDEDLVPDVKVRGPLLDALKGLDEALSS